MPTRSRHRTRKSPRKGGLIRTLLQRCVGNSCNEEPVKTQKMNNVATVPAVAAMPAMPAVAAVSTASVVPPISIAPSIACKIKGLRACTPEGCTPPANAMCALQNNQGCPAYQRGNKMGVNSAFGTVYTTCCGKDCDHVTKIVPFTKNGSNRQVVTAETFMKEITFQAEAAALGIAPAIRNVYITATHGMVVMDRMFKDFFATIKASIADDNPMGMLLGDELGSALFTLHKNGVIHRDTHDGNVMLDSDLNVKLIDYGLAARSTMFVPYLVDKFPALSDEQLAMKVYERDYMLLTNWNHVHADLMEEMPTEEKRIREFGMAFTKSMMAWYKKDLAYMTALCGRARMLLAQRKATKAT